MLFRSLINAKANQMKKLSESEYQATFSEPMKRLPLSASPPINFWNYFDNIPDSDFENHNCMRGSVDFVWENVTGTFQHVLVNSENENVFMVVVLDLSDHKVLGHRLLKLDHEYGLNAASN